MREYPSPKLKTIDRSQTWLPLVPKLGKHPLHHALERAPLHGGAVVDAPDDALELDLEGGQDVGAEEQGGGVARGELEPGLHGRELEVARVERRGQALEGGEGDALGRLPPHGLGRLALVTTGGGSSDLGLFDGALVVLLLRGRDEVVVREHGLLHHHAAVVLGHHRVAEDAPGLIDALGRVGHAKGGGHEGVAHALLPVVLVAGEVADGEVVPADVLQGEDEVYGGHLLLGREGHHAAPASEVGVGVGTCVVFPGEGTSVAGKGEALAGARRGDVEAGGAQDVVHAEGDDEVADVDAAKHLDLLHRHGEGGGGRHRQALGQLFPQELVLAPDDAGLGLGAGDHVPVGVDVHLQLLDVLGLALAVLDLGAADLGPPRLRPRLVVVRGGGGGRRG